MSFRFVSVLCALLVSALPMIPEAIAFTARVNALPMSVAETVHRGTCHPSTDPSFPVPTCVAADVSTTRGTLAPDADEIGARLDTRISYGPELPASNRIRAPSV